MSIETVNAFIFTIFGDWHMVVGALIMTLTYAYKAKNDILIIRHGRGGAARAINWGLFALIFLILAIFGDRIGNLSQRTLLRSGFGFLLLSEIAYNLPVILVILRNIISRSPSKAEVVSGRHDDP